MTDCLPHFRSFRLTEAQLQQLQALQHASGLSQSEVLRRLLTSARLPSVQWHRDLKALLKVAADQNRLGGLFKKALSESHEAADKAAIRVVLAELERNARRLRRVLEQLLQRP